MTQLKLGMPPPAPAPAHDERRPNTARISECGLYRYDLTRELGGDRTLVSMGLNPSTADAIKPDPTITKDIGFATRWQCGRVLKLNAYAYRETKPKLMFAAAKAGVDIVGPDNDRTIREALVLVQMGLGILVVSWGRNIDPIRQREVADIIEAAGVDALCLGTNNNGSPVHELYQPYGAGIERLSRWICPPVPEKKR